MTAAGASSFGIAFTMRTISLSVSFVLDELPLRELERREDCSLKLLVEEELPEALAVAVEIVPHREGRHAAYEGTPRRRARAHFLLASRSLRWRKRSLARDRNRGASLLLRRRRARRAARARAHEARGAPPRPRRRSARSARRGVSRSSSTTSPSGSPISTRRSPARPRPPRSRTASRRRPPRRSRRSSASRVDALSVVDAAARGKQKAGSVRRRPAAGERAATRASSSARRSREICGEIPFRKSMRWGAGDADVRAAGAVARRALRRRHRSTCRSPASARARTSLGHRFLAPGKVEIASAAGLRRRDARGARARRSRRARARR